MTEKTLYIDGGSLKIEDVVSVARYGRAAVLSPSARDKVKECREFVEKTIGEEKVIYGINTGFGKFANVKISPGDSDILQKNLILSHSSGTGEAFNKEEARAMMLLRANTLAGGFSGVRAEVIETLLFFLNHDIYPFIPSRGSVGASGDLAPLAHLALCLIGEGFVHYMGKRMKALEALSLAGRKPLELKAKEGISLINGTQAMSALGALAVFDSWNLLKTADIVSAMSLEALKGTDAAMDPLIHSARPHPGQVATSYNMRRILQESKIIESHKDCPMVQDPYSLRCIPQVHGAVKDSVNYVSGVLQIEINSATDNPLVFTGEKKIISGGNFHGSPVALSMDYLGISLTHLTNMAERRIDRLLSANLPELPLFLTKNGGINSGMMILQYTAAALASENKVLSHPASSDSIPTSAGQEDHVSMGQTAAIKAGAILKSAYTVFAIEAICAAQALEFLKPLTPGKGTLAAYKVIREAVAPLDNDRSFHPDIEKSFHLLKGKKFIEAVESEVGPLLLG
ncbi:MAG: histidine ammonia-lyase [Firmicutes bacterium]|nr:histidine ammonia-lyase [Bacillota bacterium]